MSARTVPPTHHAPARVYYPESDGSPLGETGYHVRAILHLLSALDRLPHGRSDTYVAADMFLYYEEGRPASVVTPDVMVINGVGRHERRTFQTWVEGAVPCVVIEVTSRSSRKQDLHRKRALYERLGVREYVVFDPLGEYLDPPLWAFRLAPDGYLPVALRPDGGVTSHELPCAFVPEGALLRVVDLAMLMAKLGVNAGDDIKTKSIDDLSMKGKKVFIRVDFNVPMEGGKVTDDFRIVSAIPTTSWMSRVSRSRSSSAERSSRFAA